jgi:hypothetical protein
MDTQASLPPGGNRERTTRDATCPDSETLAAFVDGQLDQAERDRVLRHVVECDDCLLIVGDTAAFLESEGEDRKAEGSEAENLVSSAAPAPAPVPRQDPRIVWWRKPQVLVPGGLLAAAAVALLAVRLTSRPPQPETGGQVAVGEGVGAAGGPPPAGRGVEAPYARVLGARDNLLAVQTSALLGTLTARPASARLAGLSYLPPPRVTRSATTSSLPLVVLAAAAQLEETTGGRDDWRSRWARGLAQLAGGRSDEAIASLDGAKPTEPVDPTTANALEIDRAVAHLARAERTGNQESARQALALSDGVLARDNGSLPALFNRALALEYLDRPEDAAAAWRAYLARDGDSPWADEVRQRHLR